MIRKFEKQDAEQVLQIWLKSNIQTHNFLPEAYWTSHFSMVQEQLLQAEVYVYEQDNIIQGFVGMTDHYLAGIFVHESYRSKGIGKQLLDFIKRMYAHFSLHVYCKNTGAVQFYLREGMKITSEGLEETTGEKEYHMSWELSSSSHANI